jgi:3-hydroxy-9,10-secoandrosta-1,3,5(10)-triene-9,17-dione monooxygenase
MSDAHILTAVLLGEVMASASIQSVKSPPAEELVRRARALVEKLKPLAPAAEKLRRVPQESMQLIRDAGLMRVLQPKSCGGHELSLRTHVDVVSTLAEGCSATAWLVGVGHAHSWLIGHLPTKAQQEVYGEDPDTFVAGVIGPRGKAAEQADGSCVLSGFWPFGSGCERAGWLLLGAEVSHANGERGADADFLVPVSAVELQDDWFVAGLQGTGSCSIVAKNVIVPAHRKLRMGALIERELPTYQEPGTPSLYKAQAVPVLSLCICSSALGTARAALAECLRIAHGKKVMYTNHISHEWIPNQMALGHGASLIHAAQEILYRAADDIDDYAHEALAMPQALRGRIRMDCSLAVRFCLDAVERIYMSAGASALSLSSPIQRAARDLRATNMHGLLLLDSSAEVYGRILLGLGSNSPIY